MFFTTLASVDANAGNVLEGVLQKGYMIEFSRRGFSGFMACVPQDHCV